MYGRAPVALDELAATPMRAVVSRNEFEEWISRNIRRLSGLYFTFVGNGGYWRFPEAEGANLHAVAMECVGNPELIPLSQKMGCIYNQCIAQARLSAFSRTNFIRVSDDDPRNLGG
jgi:hypothetical protein